MKCPLPYFYRSASSAIAETEMRNCLGKDCAWWDDGSGACAIWSIMSGLDALGKLLREIEQQIPK